MLTPEEVKQYIESSTWAPEHKSAVINVLPQLGRRTLSFVYAKVDSPGGAFVAPYVLGALHAELESFNAFKKGDATPLLDLLPTSLADPDWGYGEYALPFVLDMRQLVRMGRISDVAVIRALQKFVQTQIAVLPEEELIFIVHFEVVEFLRGLPLLDELKLVGYERGLLDDDEWTQKLSEALMDNAQMLGNSLATEAGKVDATVSNWLQDFVNTTPAVLTGSATYAQVQYINRSKNVAQLNPDQKNLLITLLRLYSWLLYPSVSEQEIISLQAQKQQEASAEVVEDRLSELKSRLL
jgi:hypothetical protein